MVQGATRLPISCATAAEALVKKAAAARAVESTAMNAVSSRSHSVFTLYITGQHETSGQSLQGALNLVDLAGRWLCCTAFPSCCIWSLLPQLLHTLSRHVAHGCCCCCCCIPCTVLFNTPTWLSHTPASVTVTVTGYIDTAIAADTASASSFGRTFTMQLMHVAGPVHIMKIWALTIDIYNTLLSATACRFTLK